MKNIRNALGTIVVLVLYIIQVAEAKPKEKFALVIHGGVICVLMPKKILPCHSIPKACTGAISKVMERPLL